MPDNVKGDLTAVPRICELTARRSAEGHAAQYKGPGVERQVLFPGLALLPNDLDQFKLLEPASSDAEARQDFAYWRERRTRYVKAVIEWTWSGSHKQTWASMRRDTQPQITDDGEFRDRTKNVLKSGQLREKGLTCEREQIPRIGGRRRKDKRY